MTDNPTLQITEIFRSIQGESTHAGRPCIFIRLSGCPLRCTYCDTAYAFASGTTTTINDILTQITDLDNHTKLIEITGGEPLAQHNVHDLMTRLCDAKYTVLLETCGALDIRPCDPRVIKIMDIKTPSSNESDKNLWPNINHLNSADEIKIIITSHDDYTWARDIITQYDLPNRVKAVHIGIAAPITHQTNTTNLTSKTNNNTTPPTTPTLAELAKWVLNDQLDVSLHIQLHKLIWGPSKRGV